MLCRAKTVFRSRISPGPAPLAWLRLRNGILISHTLLLLQQELAESAFFVLSADRSSAAYLRCVNCRGFVARPSGLASGLALAVGPSERAETPGVKALAAGTRRRRAIRLKGPPRIMRGGQVGRRPAGNIRQIPGGYRLRFGRHGEMRTSPEVYASRAEAERALWKMASDGRADCHHDRRFYALALLATFASLRWGEATGAAAI
jgi:hypothetical protein